VSAGLAERKCALLLTTLSRADRRHLLTALPASSALRIRRLLNALLAMPIDVAELAPSLLADEVEAEGVASVGIDELMELSARLSPPWFARVLAAWTGVDRTFCLSLLDPGCAAAVARELQALDGLPPRLAAALKAQAMAFIPDRTAA